MCRTVIVVAAETIRFPHQSAARRLARALADSDSWRVDVWDVAAKPGRGAVAAAVRRLAARRGSDRKPIVILFGATVPYRRVSWGIIKAGLRPHVVLVLHLRVDEVPMPRAAAELLALVDLVVVESRFGARAVRACLREARAHREPQIAVVPPVLEDASRSDVPRADEPHGAPFRVGCVLEPYTERDAFLALWIFRLFADGHYSVCDDCGFVTPWGERAEDFEPMPVSNCMRCRSARSRRGRTWQATLRLAAFPAPRLDVSPPNTWDLPALRSLLGLSGRVLVEGEDGFPILDTESAWLDCLTSFDAHLSVRSSAGVDRAALATRMLGVPTLSTRFGASSEILEGRVRLVEPRDVLLDAAGHWSPVMDVGQAASTLAALAAARDARWARIQFAGSDGERLAQPGGDCP